MDTSASLEVDTSAFDITSLSAEGMTITLGGDNAYGSAITINSAGGTGVTKGLQVPTS